MSLAGKDKQFDNFYVYSRIQYDCILSTEQTIRVENHQVSISHHNPWSYLSVEMSNTVYPLSDFMHKKANGQMRFVRRDFLTYVFCQPLRQKTKHNETKQHRVN